MKRWIAPFALLVLGLTAGIYSVLQRPATSKSFPAPDFSLPDLQGHVQRLSNYRGKIVFLNLWATWCPPCREEMPAMEQLNRRLKGTDFVMLAVSQDEDPNESVRPFSEQLQLSFPILLDPQGKVPPKYGVTGYPETFIIDRTGNVIEHVIGPEHWDSEASVRYFLKLLSTNSPGSKGPP